MMLRILITVSLLTWVEHGTIAQTIPALFPRASESRDVVSLDGVWNFEVVSSRSMNETLEKSPRAGTVMKMPVPSSYNDITEDPEIRDHVGIVRYQRRFFVPKSWLKDNRVVIRFGSVSYAAQVRINGQLAVTHDIGHLPFEKDITSLLSTNADNVVEVDVDNTLTETTIPQGSLTEINAGNKTLIRQGYTFDFFNYAGIHRSVYIYSTPKLYVSDISVKTSLANNNVLASVGYAVSYAGNTTSTVNCLVTVIDQNRVPVTSLSACIGTVTVSNPNLWWPYLMDPNPGYMYDLQVEVWGTDGIRDTYRQPFGIRVVSWNSTSFLINGRPVYFRGFGRHEDSDIRGKGLDLPLVIKDYGLLKWIGANSYRTSHYPYAEEIMDQADQEGIMIIDECPSVNADIYSATMLANHKRSLSELIARDKNRPSVVMWSIANEPNSQRTEAGPYFKDVVAHLKSLDTSRPVTIAMIQTSSTDKAGPYLDIISFNRYNSWYSDTGVLEVVTPRLIEEAENWRKTYPTKPVMVTEYGADSYPGLHVEPATVWSEEYQTEVMERSFEAFDTLRSRGYFIGEMIWNFADFMTAQTIQRVGGNRKGVFTRQRQPKASAHLLRERYWQLANETDKVTMPKNVFGYTKSKHIKTEL